MMEVWPSGLVVQARSPNDRKLRRSRAVVVSVPGKRSGMTGSGERREDERGEPLLTHRKLFRRHQNCGSVGVFRTTARLRMCPQPGSCLLVASVVPVYRWRELVGRRWHGSGEPVVSIPTTRGKKGSPPTGRERRTPSDEHRKGQSTDARHRGGTARSSDEGPVIGPERRGRAGQVILRSTLRGRD